MADERQERAQAENKPELLEEIRENYRIGRDDWEPRWDEGKEDMRYIAGDPWKPEERREREANHRPCLNFDEVNQYVEQLINGVREQKRSIKVIPKGGGATEKTAEYRQGRIREIEYRSNAQSAYIHMFQNAAHRGYGYLVVSKRLKYDGAVDWQKLGPRALDQEIYIRTIPNPDTVILDPAFKEADARDSEWGYIVDLMTRKTYKRRFPKAQIVDFTAEHMKLAPQWLHGEMVQVGEYWKMKRRPRTLIVLAGERIAFLDQFRTAKLVEDNGQSFLRIEGNPNVPVSRYQKVDERRVCQYLTNGLEILEYAEWPGKLIPIVPCFGKELYVEVDGQLQRVFVSLPRLGRDPQRLLNYYRSAEAEIVGQVPKSPWVGYKEFFEGNEEWETANTVPRAYLAGNLLRDGNMEPIPLPQRQIWEPPVQAMELGAEAARQAIRSAMGMSPLPTVAQRLNEKSGIALKQIESATQRGSFHFVDNYERALKKAGDIINDILDDVEDTPREVGLVKADDSYEIANLEVDELGPVNGRGEHDVTITTGPSFASQQEEAENFVNLLVSNLQYLPLAPEMKAKLIASLVKLKRLGPTGDEIVKILMPAEMQGPDGKPLPPEIQNLLMAEKQKTQALNAFAGELEKQNEELQQKLDAKVVDNEYRLQVEKLKAETQIAIAEISTKAQIINERIAFVEDVWRKVQDFDAKMQMQSGQQAHERDMTAAQQAQAAAEAQGAVATP